MKVITFVALFVATSTVAWAQPVKDATDAQEAARQHVRDMTPFVEQVVEMSKLLEAFGNVQRALSDPSQPGIAFDNAHQALENYVNDAARRNAMLDRDLRSKIEYADREITAARNGAAFSRVEDLREKLHHNVIHPLQRRAIFLSRDIYSVLQNYEGLSAQLRRSQAAVTMALGGLASDPEKP